MADADGRTVRTEDESSIVGDLMRRATSPEVLAAVAGAAAAAITKRATGHREQEDEENEDPNERDEPEAAVGEEEEDQATSSAETDGQLSEDPNEGGDPVQAAVGEEEEEHQATSIAETDGELSDERVRVVRRARQYMAELTGRQIDSISAFERGEDEWKVGVEIVEVPRIPSTTDVLASYELVLDSDGELVGYRRTRRYHRNSTDDGSHG